MIMDGLLNRMSISIRCKSLRVDTYVQLAYSLLLGGQQQQGGGTVLSSVSIEHRPHEHRRQ